MPSNITRPGEPVYVTANVTDDREVAVVQLFYRIDGECWNTTMVYNETSCLWATVIPGQLGNTSVEFFIYGRDSVGNEAASSVYSYNVKRLIIGDLDGDGDVDLYDAVTLLTHYGQKDP